MAKAKKDSIISVKLPGIDGTVIKDLKSFITGDYNISMAWAVIAVTTCILCQIAHTSNPRIKHHEYMTSESVSVYVRKLLANTLHSRTIFALVAIRQTMGYYDTLSSDTLLQESLNNDLDDLISNPTGQAATRGGIRAALTSPERTRKFRRGIMLRTSGTVCNKPLSSPTSVMSKDEAGRVAIADILKLTPFDIISKEDLIKVFAEALFSEEEGRLEFVDNFNLTSSENLTTLEKELNIGLNRTSLEINPEQLAVDKDSLSPLQQLVYNSKQKLS